MKYLKAEDLGIWEQYQKLEESYIDARQRWLSQVRKVHSGEMAYNETRPLFDEYERLCKEAQNFREEHADILLAQVDS